MSYTAPTVTTATAIDEALFEALVVEHRRELNNSILTGSSLADSTVTAHNVKLPEFKPLGLEVYEQRGVSGGIKYVIKDPANFNQVVDATIIDSGLASPVSWDVASANRVTYGNGGNRASNGIVCTAFNRSEHQVNQKLHEKTPLPGLALTVEIDRPAVVQIECKVTLNYLPSKNTTDLHNVSMAVPQHVILAYESPDGTRSPFLLNGNPYAIGYGRRCQTLYDVREMYFTGYLDVDGVTNTLGEYGFVVIPQLHQLTQTSANAFESEVALVGKSSMSADWYYY